MVIKVIYPGTFDPLTYGHLDIIIRAHKIFDKIFIAIANSPQKNPLFSLKERIVFMKQATSMLKNVIVFGFDNLTVHVMREKKIKFLIRGIRSVIDFEHEMKSARINRYLDPDIETIFMISSDMWSCLSSKLVKEIALNGGKIDQFIPDFIAKKMVKRLYNFFKLKVSH